MGSSLGERRPHRRQEVIRVGQTVATVMGREEMQGLDGGHALRSLPSCARVQVCLRNEKEMLIGQHECCLGRTQVLQKAEPWKEQEEVRHWVSGL